MSGARSAVAPRRRQLPWVVAGTAALALAVGAGAFAVVRGHDAPRRSAAVPAGSTEELGSGRTIVAPGTRTGTARSGGVVVAGADYDLGHVPLMVTAVPTWQLRNASNRVVTLGDATVDGV